MRRPSVGRVARSGDRATTWASRSCLPGRTFMAARSRPADGIYHPLSLRFGISQAAEEENAGSIRITDHKDKWMIGAKNYRRVGGYAGHGGDDRDGGRGCRFGSLFVDIDVGLVNHIRNLQALLG